jgi:hypothetical protein
MRKLKIRFAISFLVLLCLMICLTSCTRKKIVSLKTLLLEMTDRRSMTLFPEPYFNLKQFSSYDRKSDNPDGEGWYANADYTQFSGIDSLQGRKEYILFDTDGPGAIVRWWMTFAGEGSYDGIIRVYIDNDEKPVIEDNVLKVISGQLLTGEPLSSSVSPLTNINQRGHNLYMPIPFSKHCKITYECKAIVISETSRRPSVYYNICYRQYEKGTSVVSFNMNELKNAGELLETVNSALLSSSNEKDHSMKKWEKSAEISNGDSICIIPETNKAAISRLSVIITAENLPQALRSTVLKITFDGINTVWVPAGEFFGTGYKKTTSSTWYSKVSESGLMESYWLMPFKKTVSVRLINYGTQLVTAELKIETSDYAWNSKSMYFGASWHEYYNIKTAGAKSVGGTGKHCDINFADITGNGIYAGDAITIFNTADAWFGEGDEKIFVDGESFPSSIGTGTEDYYGYAWCRPEHFTHPFIAQPSGNGNFNSGQTINMRYRGLDAIPFKKSISSNIELWHWAPTIINYAMTSYMYIFIPYNINIEQRPASVRNPVAVKRSDVIKPEADEGGFIEGEYLEAINSDGGITENQYITEWNWRNGGQIWWHGGEILDKLNLRFILNDAGNYQVIACLSKAVDYAIIGFEINGQHVNKTFNGYIPDQVKSEETDLGSWAMQKGDNILTLVIKGKDKKAKPGFMAGIDYLKFIPVR